MYSYASIPLKAFKPQYMNKLCSVPVISTPLLSLLSINSPAANYQLAVLKKYPVLANILNLCTHTLTIYIHSRYSSAHSYAPKHYAYAK